MVVSPRHWGFIYSLAICAADEITISRLPLYSSILPLIVTALLANDPQKFFSTNIGDILCWHESRENMLWVFPAEVQESVALLGKAYLFNKGRAR